jgi:hypothetical protein
MATQSKAAAVILCFRISRKISPAFSFSQGCQMVYFQTKNPALVNFGLTWNGKCCYFLSPFKTFYLMAIWYFMGT